ncbi:MAG: UMP kinase [Promethearchaeota archaeon]
MKLGGSILFDENGDINLKLIKEFVEVIKSTQKVKGIVCGGGIIARKFIHTARELGVNESSLDLLGIDVARVNARLLISALGNDAYPVVVKSVEEVQTASYFNKIIIAGGFVPGQSTTTVVMQIIEAINAKNLLILTDVDGIYDKNPKEFSDAKKFDKITIDELEKLILNVGEKQSAAGEYRIFDAVSIQIFKRNNFHIRLFNGNNPNNLREVLKSGIVSSKIGTLILKK